MKKVVLAGMMAVGVSPVWAALDCPGQAELIRQAALLRDKAMPAQQALRQLNQQWARPQESFRAVNQAWKARQLTPDALAEQVLANCVLALNNPEAELAPLPMSLSDCSQARQQQVLAQQQIDQKFEVLHQEQKNLDKRLQQLLIQQNSVMDSDIRAIEAFNRQQAQYDLDLSLYRQQKADFMQSQSLFKHKSEQWVKLCNSNLKP